MHPLTLVIWLLAFLPCIGGPEFGKTCLNNTCTLPYIQYIGENKLQENFSEHKGYVDNEKDNKRTGEHYDSKGRKVSDMCVTSLEKIFSSDTSFRKKREQAEAEVVPSSSSVKFKFLKFS